MKQISKKQISAVLVLLFALLAVVIAGRYLLARQTQPVPVQQLLAEIGKPLATLREEHPNGMVFDRPDGYPDAAAICFGEVDGEVAYVFFGTQGETYLPSVMDAYSEELRCSGVLTTAGTLFPTMSDNMTFSEFFSLIGVPEYDYITAEEAVTAAGWVLFDYDGKWAALDTTDTNQTVCRDTHISITSPEIEEENRKVAQASPLAPAY